MGWAVVGCVCVYIYTVYIYIYKYVYISNHIDGMSEIVAYAPNLCEL